MKLTHLQFSRIIKQLRIVFITVLTNSIFMLQGFSQTATSAVPFLLISPSAVGYIIYHIDITYNHSDWTTDERNHPLSL
jgi:hypothetical protein